MTSSISPDSPSKGLAVLQTLGKAIVAEHDRHGGSVTVSYSVVMVEEIRTALAQATPSIPQPEQSAGEESIDKAWLRFCLEDIRLFAAQHRKEEWAKTVLRFCTEAKVKGSPLRARPQAAAQPLPQPEDMGSVRVSEELARRVIRIIEEEWGEESETALELRAALALPSTPENSNPLREALAELVACKDLKIEVDRLAQKIADDGDDMEVFRRWDEAKGDYDHRAPLAWEAARRALSGSGHPVSMPGNSLQGDSAQATNKGKAP